MDDDVMSVAKIKINDWRGKNLIDEMVQLRILRAKMFILFM